MPEAILKGKINSRVTVMDVAKAAAVSYGVAADILREKSRYSYREETIARVQQAASELSYRPSRVAQALTTGRTHQIALCVPNFEASAVLQFIRAFYKQTRSGPYDLLITSYKALQEQSAAVDGILLCGFWPLQAAPSNAPVVIVSNSYPPNKELKNHDTVLVDSTASCNDVMKHLLARGARRILLVTGGPMVHPQEPRYEAYCAAMEKAELPVEILPFNVPEEGIREEVHSVLEKYFLENGFPDAVFCSNDDVAIGAYRALRAFGRQIPKETAVVGCDDIPESKDLSPALSSIHLPFDEIAECAWKSMMRRLREPDSRPQHHQFQSYLKVRGSSCCALEFSSKGENHVYR